MQLIHLHPCIFLGHRCATHGCGTVLVFDGNCKNFRDVCKARDAGYIEYEGLEGVVKTGCMNTPKLGSRFCALHTQNVVIPQQLNPADSEEQHPQPLQSEEESVIAMIVGKTSTRHENYYQVRSIAHIPGVTHMFLFSFAIKVAWVGKSLSECTWEKQSTLPAKLVDEYEKGVSV